MSSTDGRITPEINLDPSQLPMTPNELAAHWGRSPNTVRLMCRLGVLDAVKAEEGKGEWRITNPPDRYPMGGTVHPQAPVEQHCARCTHLLGDNRTVVVDQVDGTRTRTLYCSPTCEVEDRHIQWFGKKNLWGRLFN
jgi:hypothetical protein